MTAQNENIACDKRKLICIHYRLHCTTTVNPHTHTPCMRRNIFNFPFIYPTFFVIFSRARVCVWVPVINFLRMNVIKIIIKCEIKINKMGAFRHLFKSLTNFIRNMINGNGTERMLYTPIEFSIISARNGMWTTEQWTVNTSCAGIRSKFCSLHSLSMLNVYTFWCAKEMRDSSNSNLILEQRLVY